MTEVIKTPVQDARQTLVDTWKNLPAPLKIAGYVIFIWAAWRTVPIISVILQLTVLAVGFLFILCCIGASEETVELLNEYRRKAAEYYQACTNPSNSEEEGT
jgi:hypothetical protein